MKLTLQPAPRRFDVSWPVWIVGGLWAALVLTVWLLDRARGTTTPTCLFRSATGIPCPTCGSTRCVATLARGDVAGAWLYNPFICTGLFLLAAYLLLRLGFGRTVSLGLTRRQRTIAWLSVAALFLANWAYVLRYHGAI